MNSKLSILLPSIFASISFLILNTVKLEEQGLYYDEVFQATASFAYIDHPTHQFSALEFHGIPLMNMNYIGAIKTGVYGLYLRLSGASFSVVSWRLTGIISVSIALFIFGLIVGRKIKLAPLFIFYFLFITDVTILLTTRFDWGPVAFSLSLRLIMIAFWLDGELSDSIHPLNSFVIGALFSFTVFEKLSAIVLAVPVLVMIFSSAERRNIKHIKMFFLGGLVGSLPLILVNFYSYYQRGHFISLQNQGVFFSRERNLHDLVEIIKQYLSLGAGSQVGGYILGNSWVVSSEFRETSILAVIAMIILISFLYNRVHEIQLSFYMLFSYFATALSIYFLPTRVWIHHWVIGTPFQYIAILLLLSGLLKSRFREKHLIIKSALFMLLIILSIMRLSGIVLLEQAYQRGDYSSKDWRPAFTQMAEFAATKSDDAIFVTGDWGVANQIICFLNGKTGVIYQINWQEEDTSNIVKTITDITKNTQASEMYFIFPDPPYFTEPEVRKSVLSMIGKDLSQQWHETAPDYELRELDGMIVVRFQRNNN